MSIVLELGLEHRGAREVELPGRGDDRDGPVVRRLVGEVRHRAGRPKRPTGGETVRQMARLRRSECSMPGIARRGRGRGFQYLDPGRGRITDPGGARPAA
jgi:hypothetical protein